MGGGQINSIVCCWTDDTNEYITRWVDDAKSLLDRSVHKQLIGALCLTKRSFSILRDKTFAQSVPSKPNAIVRRRRRRRRNDRKLYMRHAWPWTRIVYIIFIDIFVVIEYLLGSSYGITLSFGTTSAVTTQTTTTMKNAKFTLNEAIVTTM